MSCPFFCPTDRADDIAFPHPARLPLGAAWRGTCGAPGHQLTVLTNLELESCNLGYAHACRRLPKERACDAVRFGVVSRSGERVVIRYVLETAHLPAGNGVLEYDRVGRFWLSPVADPIQNLADTFIRSYLDRCAD